jgi:hypothetical protein
MAVLGIGDRLLTPSQYTMNIYSSQFSGPANTDANEHALGGIGSGGGAA